MSAQCAICQEVKTCFSLPCHRDHTVCKDCLAGWSRNLGHSLKCPHCRKVFGMIDVELLQTNGETISDRQKCTSCMEGGREADLAVQYCVNCSTEMCQECFQSHQRVFCGRKSHKTISFNEYRQSSDKLSTWSCERHSVEVLLVCGTCRDLACAKCQVLSLDCPSGGKHNYAALEQLAEQVELRLQERSDGLKASGLGCQDLRKKVLMEMEEYRVSIEGRRESLKQKFNDQVTQLKEEYQAKDDELQQLLQDKKHEVEQRREFLIEQEANIQELQDGFTAILSSYHPARLVISEKEILANMEPVALADDAVEFITPELVSTEVDQTNLLGMSLSVATPPAEIHQPEETSAAYMELIKEPSSLTHTRTIPPPTKQRTFTVSHFCIGDNHVVHGGAYYASPSDLNTGSLCIDCIRFDDGGNLMMLERDKDQKKSAIVTYEQKISPGGQISHTKSQSQPALHIIDCLTHFIQAEEETFYQTGFSSHKVFFHKKGQAIRELTHDDMKRPWGICRHKDQLFVACKHSIMTFSHADPSSTLRKFSTTDAQLSGICYHHGYLYAVNWDSSTGQIFIFNMEGEKLKTLEIPEAGKYMRDISIDEDGCVAVAAAQRGVVLYQLNYKE